MITCFVFSLYFVYVDVIIFLAEKENLLTKLFANSDTVC